MAIGLLAGLSVASAQAPNCTQVLRLIRTTYEQGRLHELPDLAKSCLAGIGTQGFNKDERKEAYRYLTLSYIYLEEPEKADEAMINLMNTDHFYQPNKEVDPAEFIALYNKFRHDPLFRVGLKFGMNLTQPNVTHYYNVGSAGAGKGSYSMSPSFQVFGVFEKDFFHKSPWNRLVLAAEVGYVSRAYTYTNGELALADEPPFAPVSNQQFELSHQFIDLNVIGQFKFKNTMNVQTYLGGGPGISYLLGSSNLATTVLGNGFTVTGPAIDDTETYNKLLISFTAVAGIKYKFGEVYLTAEARYQYGFTNVVNPATRTNDEVAFDYQGRYNDYHLSNLHLSIGIIYPHFKPLKLIR